MTTIATQQLRELAQQLRVDSIRATSAAGSGHPTSALSAADLMAVLWAKHLRFDFDQPHHPNRDRLVFSKGHASPLLYALYRAGGIISEDELMTLRQMGSRLEGHPVPRLPGIEVATGSLGQGLPIAVGIALAGKYLDRLPYRVWVLLGDSEMAEGSVWEALEKANYYKLTNLIGILDVNRLGQSRETEFGWNTEAYTLRARMLGWETVTVDGHDLEGIDQVLALASSERDRPLLIVAKTVKGRGVAAVENQNGRHGKALDDEMMKTGIAELGGVRHLQVKPQPPEEVEPAPQPEARLTFTSDRQTAAADISCSHRGILGEGFGDRMTATIRCAAAKSFKPFSLAIAGANHGNPRSWPGKHSSKLWQTRSASTASYAASNRSASFG